MGTIQVGSKKNNYLDQYSEKKKLFFEEYVGEGFWNLFISYSDKKNFHPIQVVDLRFQFDHIHPEKTNYLKNIEVNFIRLIMLLDILLYQLK